MSPLHVKIVIPTAPKTRAQRPDALTNLPQLRQLCMHTCCTYWLYTLIKCALLVQTFCSLMNEGNTFQKKNYFLVFYSTRATIKTPQKFQFTQYSSSLIQPTRIYWTRHSFLNLLMVLTWNCDWWIAVNFYELLSKIWHSFTHVPFMELCVQVNILIDINSKECKMLHL